MENIIIYPPILPTYQTAYIMAKENSMRIIFSNPPANTFDLSSAEVEIQIKDQYSGLSCLSSGDRYSVIDNYVDIPYENLRLFIDTWYQIQLRFVTKEGDKSDWSSISLIRTIGEPNIDLKSPSDDISSMDIEVLGTISFKNSSEILKSYNLVLFQGETGKELKRIDGLIPQATNQIGPVTLASFFNITSSMYQIGIEYSTLNLYSGDFKSTGFTPMSVKESDLSGLFKATPINEKGYIEIQFGLEKITEDTIYYVRRASQKDFFETKETIFEIDLSKFNNGYPKIPIDSKSNYLYSQVFADITAESGIIYKYYLVDNKGKNYTLKDGADSCFLDAEDIFLIDKDIDYKINLNPQIQNYAYTTSENIVNTLGSKYPFIRKNSKTKYRTFTLNGTICAYGQGENTFINLNKNLKTQALISSFLKEYKAKKGILPWNDYILEKTFKESAIEYLTNSKPKIFKSFGDGNMIVYLTGITFTPNTQLGRMIYDFQATVTEIAEFTVENCYNYGLLEKNAAELYIEPNYYLITKSVEGSGALTALQEKKYKSLYSDEISSDKIGYLCLQEVSSNLKKYIETSELDDILLGDSFIKRGAVQYDS